MYNMILPPDCIMAHGTSAYKLYKYPPEKKHDPDYALARSVIYNHEHKMVCFSPPKSIAYESFKSQFPIENAVIELFVEGTMINVFFDKTWRISTKSVVGAMCTFESNVPFADLFKECMEAEQLQYSQLDRSYCYSFVMQHPKNQIVLPVLTPKLWLVAVYEIQGGRVEERPVPFLNPPRFVFRTYEEAFESVQTFPCKGYMLKCNGVRAKIRNERYNTIALIRGNVPFAYKYLTVRNTPDAITHFTYFPRDKERALQIEDDIQHCSKCLLEEYRSCFIRKTIKHSDSKMKSYLYDIHGIYLKETKPCSMYKKKILDYLNALPPARLSHVLKLTMRD